MDPYGYPYPWHQTPYNPHLYLPPQYNDFYRHKPFGWHYYNNNNTPSQTPHLNPVLAANATNIRYDLRKTTKDGILLSTYQQVAHQPAFAQPTREVRIVSKAFPWTLDIRGPEGSAVTCGAIFEGLYTMLQQPIADSEWGIVIHDKLRKETIEQAGKARHKKDKDTQLKRVDWLGETTAFKGLERDDEFETKRLLPGMQACQETWVVMFGRP